MILIVLHEHTLTFSGLTSLIHAPSPSLPLLYWRTGPSQFWSVTYEAENVGRPPAGSGVFLALWPGSTWNVASLTQLVSAWYRHWVLSPRLRAAGLENKRTIAVSRWQEGSLWRDQSWTSESCRCWRCCWGEGHLKGLVQPGAAPTQPWTSGGNGERVDFISACWSFGHRLSSTE